MCSLGSALSKRGTFERLYTLGGSAAASITFSGDNPSTLGWTSVVMESFLSPASGSESWGLDAAGGTTGLDETNRYKIPKFKRCIHLGKKARSKRRLP